MSDQKPVEVATYCRPCGGTGIYQGFTETEGEGAVCQDCDGSGQSILRIEPFVKRKLARGITTVKLPTFPGSAPTQNTVTYEEFLQGKRPS